MCAEYGINAAFYPNVSLLVIFSGGSSSSGALNKRNMIMTSWHRIFLTSGIKISIMTSLLRILVMTSRLIILIMTSQLKIYIMTSQLRIFMTSWMRIWIMTSLLIILIMITRQAIKNIIQVYLPNKIISKPRLLNRWKSMEWRLHSVQQCWVLYLSMYLDLLFNSIREKHTRIGDFLHVIVLSRFFLDFLLQYWVQDSFTWRLVQVETSCRQGRSSTGSLHCPVHTYMYSCNYLQCNSL